MEPYLRPEGQQLRQGDAPSSGRPVSEENPLALLLAIMGDPRNSWMGGPGKIVHGAEALPALVAGLGPLFKSGRGWEVLHEYMQKGGTPKSLRDLLRGRGYRSADTDEISRAVRQGTDLAAPPGHGAYKADVTAEMNAGAAARRARYPESEINARLLLPDEQRGTLEAAARHMKIANPVTEGRSSAPTAGAYSKLREDAQMNDALPSGAQGQAAYLAIASRMGRLMDDPNFLSLRQHYLPPPVSDAAYYKEFPIEGQAQREFYRSIPMPEVPLEAIHRHIEALSREQRGLAPPRTFSAAENQRTTDLNRRADQNQNP